MPLRCKREDVAEYVGPNGRFVRVPPPPFDLAVDWLSLADANAKLREALAELVRKACAACEICAGAYDECDHCAPLHALLIADAPGERP